MESQTNAGHFLPEGVNDAIWRIIGNDESPLARETTSLLIEQTIRKHAKHVPSATRDHAIAVVHGWFEFHGDKGWIKEDIRESVAQLIVDGIRQALSTQYGIGNHETAFCAVGSIQPDVAMDIISSSWSHEELDTFIRYAFKTLETLCEKDAVLNPDRVESFGISGVRASIDVIPTRERLETYWRLKDYDWYLYSSVANMIEFLVMLNPEHFYTLVQTIDHPVIQLRAARCITDRYADADHHMPLQWLTNKSTDSLVALAIVHILDRVNRLDSDLRWDTERGREQDNLDPSASCLLENTVERLGKLEPTKGAKWVVELLNNGISALNASGRNEKPRRVEQVEELCQQQLERLVRQYWSDELLDEFRDGLCLTPLVPRTLPLVQVAYDVRESDPERSDEIARLILDAHEQQITESLEGERGFFYNLSYWPQRDRVDSLGLALILSDKELDLPEWVSERCRALPLSVWDAEEDYRCFLNAENVAQFRFLVALHAIQKLADVGRTLDPASALTLAENFWMHSQFAGRHIRRSEGSDVAAFAARVAVHLGKPSDDWVLDQAENPGVGPLTLLALIHQRMSGADERIEMDDRHQALFDSELRRIASSRFRDVKGLEPTDLYHLGELWLLLEAADEAKATAMATVSLPQRQLTRAHKVLALQLLAFSSSKQGLAHEEENMIAALYSELWASYTPTEERNKRQQIDYLLRS